MNLFESCNHVARVIDAGITVTDLGNKVCMTIGNKSVIIDETYTNETEIATALGCAINEQSCDKKLKRNRFYAITTGAAALISGAFSVYEVFK